MARPPFANERITRTQSGDVTLKLKKAFSDGTTHIVFTPPEFIEKLSALVPKPRIHLIRYAGVFARHAKIRPDVLVKARMGEGTVTPSDPIEPIFKNMIHESLQLNQKLEPVYLKLKKYKRELGQPNPFKPNDCVASDSSPEFEAKEIMPFDQLKIYKVIQVGQEEVEVRELLVASESALFRKTHAHKPELKTRSLPHYSFGKTIKIDCALAISAADTYLAIYEMGNPLDTGLVELGYIAKIKSDKFL